MRAGPQTQVANLLRSCLLGGFKYNIHTEGNKHMSDAEMELDRERRQQEVIIQ